MGRSIYHMEVDMAPLGDDFPSRVVLFFWFLRHPAPEGHVFVGV